MTASTIEQLANLRVLGSLLDTLRQRWGQYELLEHHQQGEFHHDVFIKIPEAALDLPDHVLPGQYLIVSTNCNGGIKEVLCTDRRADPQGLWHHRCPENPEFSGELPPILAAARTEHWFDPCELLLPDARSELKPEARERQTGGGWRKKQHD